MNDLEYLQQHTLNSSIDLNGLHSDLVAKVVYVMKALEQKGWQPVIGSAERTISEEREKVSEGYSKTMHSMHLVGRAVDIVDKRYGWKGPAAYLGFQFWRDLGDEAHKIGLTWGGDWGHGYQRYINALKGVNAHYLIDVAHVQL